MCLAVPGKIIKKINCEEAEVLVGKIKKLIRIDFLPEIEVGDYVLIHAGYGITKLHGKEAKEINKAWEEIGL